MGKEHALRVLVEDLLLEAEDVVEEGLRVRGGVSYRPTSDRTRANVPCPPHPMRQSCAHRAVRTTSATRSNRCG